MRSFAPPDLTEDLMRVHARRGLQFYMMRNAQSLLLAFSVGCSCSFTLLHFHTFCNLVVSPFPRFGVQESETWNPPQPALNLCLCSGFVVHSTPAASVQVWVKRAHLSRLTRPLTPATKFQTLSNSPRLHTFSLVWKPSEGCSTLSWVWSYPFCCRRLLRLLLILVSCRAYKVPC